MVIGIDEKVRLLKTVDIFSKSKDALIEIIADALIELYVLAGRSVITKGDLGNCMYILYKGRVKVHDGEHTIVELGEGSIFGEFSLLDSEPRSASVSTLTEAVLFRLDQDVFYTIIDEYPEVTKSVIRMIVNRLRNQNNNVIAGLKRRESELKQLVEERTIDLQRKNEELNGAYDEIKAQNENIEAAYKEIHEKNDEITSSIRYARRIQFAILPKVEYIQRSLPESFVIYKPKDIVSGDFYWFTELDDQVLFSAVDCTGHGVPGAFMSVLGNSLLNQIVKERRIPEPNAILDALNEKVVETLNQVDPNTVTNDGMDLAMCVYYPADRVLHYSGAQRPLFFFRGNEMTQVSGDKYSIGGSGYLNKRPPYTLHALKVQPGDTVYIFSDGYADQFGGDQGKKMQTSRFANLLQSIQDKPLQAHQAIIDDFYEDWKGAYEQIDDVVVIGVRFS
jgi:serine phosphatase RsbU (regulator of sigma subunit)